MHSKRENRFRPRKDLGQVFLVDKNLQKKVVDSCQLNRQDAVLEIGSGRGELTLYIVRSVRRLVALEQDRKLYEDLARKFGNYNNIELLNRDILKFDIKEYFAGEGKIKIIGNIPYYISSPIIEHLLRQRENIDSIYLTLQKEFAQRLIAVPPNKDYGALSCFAQFYTKPQILFLIKKGSFWPRPKVDSCFVKLKVRDNPAIYVKDEKLFFKIIRASFNKRRKILSNSLKGIVAPLKLESYFRYYNLDSRIRPEALSLKNFAALSDF